MVVTVLRRLDAPPDPGLTCRGGTECGHFLSHMPLGDSPCGCLCVHWTTLTYSLQDRRGSPGKYLERGRRYSNTSSKSIKEFICVNSQQFPSEHLSARKRGEPRPTSRVASPKTSAGCSIDIICGCSGTCCGLW